MKRLIISCDGIALTEAVAVIPFLIAVWCGSYAVYNYYVVKLSAMTHASGEALIAAGEGECSNQSTDVTEVGAGSTALPDSGASDAISKLAGIHPLALVHVMKRVTHTEKRWNQTASATGTKMLACNTKPVDGLMEQIAQTVKIMVGVDE